jgi:hypothetical protein
LIANGSAPAGASPHDQRINPIHRRGHHPCQRLDAQFGRPLPRGQHDRARATNAVIATAKFGSHLFLSCGHPVGVVVSAAKYTLTVATDPNNPFL